MTQQNVHSHLKLATVITKLLDNQFKIGNVRFGLDPLIGLIPGIGDVISLGLSCYLLWIGLELKLPTDKILQMLGNILADFLLGFFPVIGDLTDFVYKANSRNLEIIEKFLKKDAVEGNVIE